MGLIALTVKPARFPRAAGGNAPAGGVKSLGGDVQIERQLPAQMVFAHLHSLPVGDPLQKLEQEHAQQHGRFHAGPSVAGAVTLLQFGASPQQQREDLLGEKPVTIAWGEEFSGENVDGAEERSLGIQDGQTHKC